MAADYKAMLIAYIAMVRSEEGDDFINETNLRIYGFNEEEQAEMLQLVRESYDG